MTRRTPRFMPTSAVNGSSTTQSISIPGRCRCRSCTIGNACTMSPSEDGRMSEDATHCRCIVPRAVAGTGGRPGGWIAGGLHVELAAPFAREGKARTIAARLRTTRCPSLSPRFPDARRDHPRRRRANSKNVSPRPRSPPETIVVDSGSRDDTVEIARRMGARVVSHDVVGLRRRRRTSR